MSRKLFFVLLEFILLSSLLYIGSSPVVESTNGSYVWNLNTDLSYATIQEAINADETLDGHKLGLPLSVFYEHVVVNKSVSLEGAQSIEHPEYVPIIDGGGTGTVVTVEADDVSMWHIKIINGTNGIVLEDTNNSTLWLLEVVDNAETGIYFHNSRNCTLKSSIMKNNLYGVYIQSSTNNTIHYNDFINNTYQVHIETINGYPPNTWDDGVDRGNYWSDYEDKYPDAKEIDGTGIWETPYVIDENNQDNYPIVPEFQSFLILPLFMIATLLAVIIYRRKHSMRH